MPIIPALQKRMEEDPRQGQKWMEKWTLILAVPMAALQAVGQVNLFNSQTQSQVVPNFGLFTPGSALTSWTIIISMTAGTMFAIWLGELISEYGIRNQGLSLIIFAGIVSRIPANLGTLFTDRTYWWLYLTIMIIMTILIVFAIVYVQQGRRNIPVLYPGRRMGSRMSMPVRGTLPLMVNMAGMIPLIFAQSLLTFPAIVASFFVTNPNPTVSAVAVQISSLFGGNSPFYYVMYFLMVVGFSFFYTSVLFQQQNYGENLKKSGAQIPGVKPGAPTQKYLNKVLSRITLPGALFLGFIAILPWLISLAVPGIRGNALLLTSSAGLLIVVGVVRDLFFNIEAELRIHGYDDVLLIR